jgi:hypothetical protein
MMAGETVSASFVLPEIYENPLGWGPDDSVEEFKNIPYGESLAAAVVLRVPLSRAPQTQTHRHPQHAFSLN